MTNSASTPEKVTYEVAQRVKDIYANLTAEVVHYNWDANFCKSYLKERIESLGKEVNFIPFEEYTTNQLKSLGFCVWSENLYLIPFWMYNYLPFGYNLTCISGQVVKVCADYKSAESPDYISNDIRCGCLAYGITIVNNKELANA